MKHSIATIISYCSNDYRFLSRCIEGVRPFSSQILITASDHFFNGEKENGALLHQSFIEHPDLTFIEYPYLTDRLYSPFLRVTPDDPSWALYWHSTARYVGAQYVEPGIDYILFIDADEIFEGETCLNWLRKGEYRAYDAMRLPAYYYGLKPSKRAVGFQPLSLLVRRSELLLDRMINPRDRHGLFSRIEGNKLPYPDVEPFIHHYSWVRPLQESLKKARSWAHAREKDWADLLHRSFQGTVDPELFDGLSEFIDVEPLFDPLTVPLPTTCPIDPPSNMLRVQPDDLFRREIIEIL
jgi:hypothetical protein